MRMQKGMSVGRLGAVKSNKGDVGYFKADPIFNWKPV